MKYKITEKPSSEDKEIIFQKLLKYNFSKIEDKEPKELGIFLEDKEGSKVAGLIGETHGNWLEIEYLWVDEENRGQNIGRELMKKAETIGRERGCRFVFLNTFSFQAPEFYVKLGYEEKFVQNEYPRTGKRHYYTKSL
ncbi:GNAT family N-acetyltransferase [Clostridium paraputrificum]|uniref:GNAT family N-acetyltransferase n=1 Tax=Clostridium paraputrificum TaxID=29363 RepID=UPI003D349619